jgi:hypothetical protein
MMMMMCVKCVLKGQEGVDGEKLWGYEWVRPKEWLVSNAKRMKVARDDTRPRDPIPETPEK